VEVTEIVVDPLEDGVTVLQWDGDRVAQVLADWEGLALLVRVLELHRDGLEVELVLTETLADTVCDKLPVEQDVEDTEKLVVPLRLLLTVALCVEVSETVPVPEGEMVELIEGEVDCVEDRLPLSVPLPVLVPLLQ
jgi:hypothetical protein